MESDQKEFLEMARNRQMALPEDMRQKMQQMVKKEGARATKDLHSAVRHMGQARDGLEEALQALSNMITSWRKFLTDAVKTWEDYTALFQKQDKELQDNIKQAQDTFNSAKSQAAESQEAAGKINAIEIKDEDEAYMEGQAHADQPAVKLHAGLQNLTASMQQLREQAHSIEVEEKAAKRPRTTAVVHDLTMEDPDKPVPTASSPFASPGCR